jgi:hypothetical protein
MDAWRASIGPRIPTTCAAAIELAERRDGMGQLEHPMLHEAIEMVASDRGKLSKQRLGNYLSRVRGRVLNGLYFEQVSQSQGLNQWQINRREADQEAGRRT